MENSKSIPVKLCGSVNVSNIDDAYAKLCAALGEPGDVQLDIADVVEADLTFVQLLEVARRDAVEDGRTLTLCAPAEGAVLEVLQRGGFLNDAGSDRAKFWLQGTMSQ